MSLKGALAPKLLVYELFKTEDISPNHGRGDNDAGLAR